MNTTQTDHPRIHRIREFWEEHPCGHETGAADDRLTYFTEIERYRYELLPWIADAARFEQFAGQQVLEIGCGMGTDGAQFARAGAQYTGVDLTHAAVTLAEENFSRRGLSGRFLIANAEELPFEDASFDHVYSFGVIHHTNSPPAVMQQIYRVLRPGGTVTVMLYNRNSVNYRLEIMVLRKIGRFLLRPRWAPSLLSRFGLPRETLDGHRQQLLRVPNPTHDQWVSMNTDGPDCPLARVYSAREVRALFESFEDVSTNVHMFDRRHWPIVGQLLPTVIVELLGRYLGWCRMVYGSKPVH